MDFPLQSSFLAIPLEKEAKWQFQALQDSIKEFAEILNFQNPKTPHLTLYYWKELMEIEFPRVRETAAKIAEKTGCFNLPVVCAGTFGLRGEDRVLFLECAFSDELAKIKKACPWPDDRPFRAHITLARINHPQKFAAVKKKIMKQLKDIRFDINADRLRFYSKISGMRQTPVEDFVFSG